MDKNKTILMSILLFLGVISGIVYAGYTYYDEETYVTQVVSSCDNSIELEDNELMILVNGYSIIVDLDEEESIYNATQMTTEYSNEVVVCNAEDLEININDEELNNEAPIYVELETLATDEYIELEVDEKTYYVRTLHEDINFTVEGESEEGYYYFDYNNAAVKTDSQGSVVFYKITDFIRNFKRWEIDDEVYYAYLERATEYDNIDTDGCAHMRLVVLNEEYKEIDSVEYLLTDNGIDENHSLENHEYQLLDLGHYIVTGYVAVEVDNVPSDLTTDGSSDANVLAAVFQEIKDGEVVFEFNSTNYPELYEYSSDNNQYGVDNYEDYMHMNSVSIDSSDDNYIVSLRSAECIIKIDRTTGEIIWILGGEGDMFGIEDYQQFSRQHYATISINNTLTIYNNGVSDEQSSIMEFTLDEENLEIIEYSEYMIEGYYGSIRGSVTRLDEEEDIFLTSWGHTQDNNAIITEYNYTTGEKIIEFYDETGGNSKNYRVHKYDN